MKKVTKNKKKRDRELPEAKTTEMVFSTSHVNEGKNSAGMSDKKNKLKKKKRNKENSEDGNHEDLPHNNVDGDVSNQQIDNLDAGNSPKKMKKVAKNKKRKLTEVVVSPSSDDVNMGKTSDDKKKNKLKKKKKIKQKRKEDEHLLHSSEVGANSKQQIGKSKSIDATLFDNEDGVYEISSGEEDETTGMKRWICEYHEGRPGAEVLLQRINDFLVDYWAQKEKERKERESEAAEGGWTVVTHVKGRKKTTDAESGTTVGSVAQAAVMDNISKKKNKQVGLNFYRFQRREAQRNEIMMLQSKFEQDKKRIQQMRAARKFRPY